MKNLYESIIVFSAMTGLLLPARLLFVTYISDDWLGSFGIISIISVAILVLAKKKKLGEFGNMFQRQIEKLLTGKRKILVYVESVFVIFLLGVMILAINLGNSIYLDVQNELLITPQISRSQNLTEYTNNWTINDWLQGFLAVPIAFVTAFPQMSAVIAQIDAALNGWLLHFYTVGFVEYTEFLGILMLYRFVIKTKSKAAIIP